MNKTKGLVIILLALLFFSLPAAAFSAIGSPLSEEKETVSPGLNYSRILSQKEKSLFRSYIFEYTPGAGTLPIVRYGDKIYGRDTLTSLMNRAGKEGYDVVGGINADFFSYYTGVPLSGLISDGLILSSNVGGNAIGWKSDGTFLIGNPDIGVSLLIGGKEYTVDHFNKYPTVYGVYALSDAFAESTKSTFPSREIVCTLSGKIGLPGFLTGRVKEVRNSVQDGKIPSGTVVVVIPDALASSPVYSAVKEGDDVIFSLSIASEWKDVVTAVGGGDILVSDGKVCKGIADEAHEKQKQPRTAIGVRKDGTLVCFAVDGRDDTSVGLTLDDLAQTMLEFDCVTALNLDGGGSTTFAVRSAGSEKPITVNTPSGGTESPVADAVLFVNTLPGTGIPSSLSLSPNAAYLMKGSSLSFSAVLRDTAMKPIPGASLGNIDFSCENGKGVFSGNTFRATEVGSTEIKASTVYGGKTCTGSATVRIVDKLSGIFFSSDLIEIPTAKTATVSVGGTLDGIDVIFSPDALEWHFDKDEIAVNDPKILAACRIAYLDKDGVIHPNKNTPFESVKLIASYGEVKAEITVVTGREEKLLNAMEYGFEDVFSGEGVSFVQSPPLVQGSHSLLFTGKDLVYFESKPIDDAAFFTVWTDSFPLNNPCFVTVLDANGKEYKLPYEIEKDYSFRNLVKMKAVVPDSLLQPMTVTSPFSATHPVSLLLDAFTVSFGDSKPIFADMAGHWAEKDAETLFDAGITSGIPQDGKLIYDPSKPLTRAEFAKMLISYLGVDTGSDAALKLPYTDLAQIPDWALPFVRTAYRTEMMRGRDNGNGKVSFAPLDKITRTEVMYVFGSLVGNVTPSPLAFADEAKIPQWAREKIALTCGAGIVNGYEDNTLRPLNDVTRGEIASLFARLLKHNGGGN